MQDKEAMYSEIVVLLDRLERSWIIKEAIMETLLEKYEDPDGLINKSLGVAKEQRSAIGEIRAATEDMFEEAPELLPHFLDLIEDQTKEAEESASLLQKSYQKHC